MSQVRVDAVRVVVFLSEDDRHHHRSLLETLLARAREQGVIGATVWRAIEGFGRSGDLRTTRFPDADLGLPLMLEVVDHADSVDRFIESALELAPDAVISREPVTLLRLA